MKGNTREACMPPAYHLGVNARIGGRPKSAPANYGIQLRHWWLAGWNDQDIAIRDSMP